MRTKFSEVLTLILAFVVQITFAQEKTISGTVSDNGGLPLPGVNIVVKGTSNGTQSDFDGKYTIEANKGAVLTYTYVGFATQEKVVGDSNTINIQLAEDAAQLEEVVVTAQGIRREKKSLGYAVSTVANDKIEQKGEADIGRILTGKAAGVNITSTNGLSGSGTNIIIRGYSSVTGSNQPLFVVDGVPFDGGTNTQSNFLDNNTESSRFLDLDPNSIESVNVLKGLSATTLYGQAGSNGVIVITTKNGSTAGAREKFEVSVTQSIFTSHAILPKYQNNYGGGFHQDYGFFFSNWGPGFDSDLSANPNFIGIASDGTTLVNGPLGAINDQSLVIGFEDQIDIPYEYKPYDSVEDFFKTGTTSTTTVNISGGGEKARFNVSYTHLDEEGVTPGNELTRNNFGLGGNMKLSNKLTVNGVINYALTDFKSPPVAPSFGSGTGFDGGSVFGDLMYTPRSVNLFGLPYQAADGRSVYYRSGNDIQNPRWTVENVKATQNVRRVFGSIATTYELNDWINLMYRIGIDQYTEANTYGQNRGGVDGEQLGIYRTSSVTNTIWDHTLSATANKDLSEKLNLNVNLGFNPRHEDFIREGVESVDQLSFGILEHYNFASQSAFNSFTNLPIGDKETQNTMGVYFDSTFSYDDYLYLNLAGRNDWSSTLELDNNSLFYPAASVSFIPTTAFTNLESDALNYLKLRFGYGSSAGFPIPYRTRSFLTLNPRGFVGDDVVPINNVNTRLGNPDLKPELVSEFEFGIDTKLFNRLDFNVSVFSKKTTDLLTDQTLDYATGYEVTQVNIGELQTQGIEIDYNIDIIRPNSSDGFKWNLAGNFYADENEVTDLDDNVDQILLTFAVTGEAANYAVEGRPYGVILGSTVARDETTGNRLVDADGNYIINEDITEIGDPNADWTTNLNSTFSYKGFSLYMDWQYRYGGDIYSTTTASLIGRGVVDLDDPLDREALYVLPGVQQVFDDNGNVTGTIPNTTQITATNLGFDNYGIGSANEFRIYDGTTLRLNEVSLSYRMPAKFLNKTPFGSLTLKASGFNVWYKAFNFPDDVRFDTNSLSTGVGNGLGIDFITGPSIRRYGLSVQATF
ncbi:SusC/RagA family TonB-linked outer membrane protein [Aquimarina pacifica]|uniref:SusC/RagA family TonB-linked outer membrane protein n=1 Tax=Aquimarina pacifica TaxID=1296415 RepID=UPI0004701C8B|nr:SusC/RagA family TonB-linked outer membrane protein [Aquimarina pacifica]